MGDKIQVGVRVRPMLPFEEAQGTKSCITHPTPCQIQLGAGTKKQKEFTFDHVFPSTVNQQDVYTAVMPRLRKDLFTGYNVTVMAYGQTGSGKTYTMGSATASDDTNLGLIPRFIRDMFRGLGDSSDARLSGSFLEIYGEDVFDLLNNKPNRPSLPLREAKNVVTVEHLKQVPLCTYEDAMNCLRAGTENRTTAATLMNGVSSRSHAVFQVTLEQQVETDGSNNSSSSSSSSGGDTLRSTLTFVDLAGSERLGRTGAMKDKLLMTQGIQINKGLLALGSVITALASNASHVPYRSSKLTRLLAPALGGNSRTFFIACMSPAEVNLEETLSTLVYANRAKDIRNAAVVNLDPRTVQLMLLQNMSSILTDELIWALFGDKRGGKQLEGEEGGGEKTTGETGSGGVEAVEGGAEGNEEGPEMEVENQMGGGGEKKKTEKEKGGAEEERSARSETALRELKTRPDVLAFLQQLEEQAQVQAQQAGGGGAAAGGAGSILSKFMGGGGTGAVTGGGGSGDGGDLVVGGGRGSGSVAAAAAAAATAAIAATTTAAPSLRGAGFDTSGSGSGSGALRSELKTARGGGEGGEKEEEEEEEESEGEESVEVLRRLLDMEKNEVAFDQTSAATADELQDVETELASKQRLLDSAAASVAAFDALRAKYESARAAAAAVEAERGALEAALRGAEAQVAALDRAEKEAKRKGGVVGRDAGVSLEKQRRVAEETRAKLKDVTAELGRLKSAERTAAGQARGAERARQQASRLQASIQGLKATKVALMRRQKEQMAKHKSYMASKRTEVQMLQRKDRKQQREVMTLQQQAHRQAEFQNRRNKLFEKNQRELKKTRQQLLTLLQAKRKEARGAGPRTRTRTRAAPSAGRRNARPTDAASAAAVPGASGDNGGSDSTANASASSDGNVPDSSSGPGPKTATASGGTAPTVRTLADAVAEEAAEAKKLLLLSALETRLRIGELRDQLLAQTAAKAELQQEGLECTRAHDAGVAELEAAQAQRHGALQGVKRAQSAVDEAQVKPHGRGAAEAAAEAAEGLATAQKALGEAEATLEAARKLVAERRGEVEAVEGRLVGCREGLEETRGELRMELQAGGGGKGKGGGGGGEEDNVSIVEDPTVGSLLKGLEVREARGMCGELLLELEGARREVRTLALQSRADAAAAVAAEEAKEQETVRLTGLVRDLRARLRSQEEAFEEQLLDATRWQMMGMTTGDSSSSSGGSGSGTTGADGGAAEGGVGAEGGGEGVDEDGVTAEEREAASLTTIVTSPRRVGGGEDVPGIGAGAGGGGGKGQGKEGGEGVGGVVSGLLMGVWEGLGQGLGELGQGLEVAATATNRHLRLHVSLLMKRLAAREAKLNELLNEVEDVRRRSNTVLAPPPGCVCGGSSSNTNNNSCGNDSNNNNNGMEGAASAEAAAAAAKSAEEISSLKEQLRIMRKAGKAVLSQRQRVQQLRLASGASSSSPSAPGDEAEDGGVGGGGGGGAVSVVGSERVQQLLLRSGEMWEELGRESRVQKREKETEGGGEVEEGVGSSVSARPLQLRDLEEIVETRCEQELSRVQARRDVALRLSRGLSHLIVATAQRLVEEGGGEGGGVDELRRQVESDEMTRKPLLPRCLALWHLWAPGRDQAMQRLQQRSSLAARVRELAWDLQLPDSDPELKSALELLATMGGGGGKQGEKEKEVDEEMPTVLEVGGEVMSLPLSSSSDEMEAGLSVRAQFPLTETAVEGWGEAVRALFMRRCRRMGVVKGLMEKGRECVRELGLGQGPGGQGGQGGEGGVEVGEVLAVVQRWVGRGAKGALEVAQGGGGGGGEGEGVSEAEGTSLCVPLVTAAVVCDPDVLRVLNELVEEEGKRMRVELELELEQGGAAAGVHASLIRAVTGRLCGGGVGGSEEGEGDLEEEDEGEGGGDALRGVEVGVLIAVVGGLRALRSARQCVLARLETRLKAAYKGIVSSAKGRPRDAGELEAKVEGVVAGRWAAFEAKLSAAGCNSQHPLAIQTQRLYGDELSLCAPQLKGARANLTAALEAAWAQVGLGQGARVWESAAAAENAVWRQDEKQRNSMGGGDGGAGGVVGEGQELGYGERWMLAQRRKSGKYAKTGEGGVDSPRSSPLPGRGLGQWDSAAEVSGVGGGGGEVEAEAEAARSGRARAYAEEVEARAVDVELEGVWQTSKEVGGRVRWLEVVGRATKETEARQRVFEGVKATLGEMADIRRHLAVLQDQDQRLTTKQHALQRSGELKLHKYCRELEVAVSSWHRQTTDSGESGEEALVALLGQKLGDELKAALSSAAAAAAAASSSPSTPASPAAEAKPSPLASPPASASPSPLMNVGMGGDVAVSPTPQSATPHSSSPPPTPAAPGSASTPGRASGRPSRRTAASTTAAAGGSFVRTRMHKPLAVGSGSSRIAAPLLQPSVVSPAVPASASTSTVVRPPPPPAVGVAGSLGGGGGGLVAQQGQQRQRQRGGGYMSRAGGVDSYRNLGDSAAAGGPVPSVVLYQDDATTSSASSSSSGSRKGSVDAGAPTAAATAKAKSGGESVATLMGGGGGGSSHVGGKRGREENKVVGRKVGTPRKPGTPSRTPSKTRNVVGGKKMVGSKSTTTTPRRGGLFGGSENVGPNN